MLAVVVLVIVDEGNEFGHQRLRIGVDGMVLICRHQIGLHQNRIGVDLTVDVSCIGIDVDDRGVVGQLVVCRC